MPQIDRPDGTIDYEVFGRGFPVLLFAPGGLRSRIENWHATPQVPPRPCVDWTRLLPEAGFMAIAMDQRNSGGSCCAIEADHGWHTYTADHLALMDHLGHQRFHMLGACIGGSFCLKACQTAPERTVSAVLQNPIGLNPEQPDFFPNSHVAWGLEQRAQRPSLDAAAIDAFGRTMWARDFVFSVDRSFIQSCKVPTMLLPGTDIPHPAVTSRELAALLPDVHVLTEWRCPAHRAQQETEVVSFLRRQTPG